MVRDFGPDEWLDWAADRDGEFEFEASRLDLSTGETVVVTERVLVISRVSDGRARVSETDHALVSLFSAPACGMGKRMRVRFEPVAGGPAQWTPYRDCDGVGSMNFLLAGMLADTDYVAQAEFDDGGRVDRSIPFRTGSLPALSWGTDVVKAAGAGSSHPYLISTSGGSQVATDLLGNVAWFNPAPVSYMTSFDPGGKMWGFVEDGSLAVERQLIRKVDLLGHTVLETNAERVNQQLMAMGKRTITGFHHEVRTISGGRVVALASVEQLMTDVQGPGTVDVLADMIIVFDEDLQVVWTWDAFDHLDPRRVATLGEVCPPLGAGCPPILLAPVANDWTHGNAVHQTPDGDLLYSARHQDWLIKIRYGNGDGDGKVIWKLGRDGDFQYQGAELFPWFSHQHDASFEGLDRIMVFDNGNLRITENGGGQSRGQVMQIDEQARTMSLVLNADLGVYAQAVGSAQSLGGGRYHFNAGLVYAGRAIQAFAFEVDSAGKSLSTLHSNTLIYRSIRLRDLYGSTQ